MTTCGDRKSDREIDDGYRSAMGSWKEFRLGKLGGSVSWGGESVGGRIESESRISL